MASRRIYCLIRPSVCSTLDEPYIRSDAVEKNDKQIPTKCSMKFTPGTVYAPAQTSLSAWTIYEWKVIKILLFEKRSGYFGNRNNSHFAKMYQHRNYLFQIRCALCACDEGQAKKNGNFFTVHRSPKECVRRMLLTIPIVFDLSFVCCQSSLNYYATKW